MYLKILPKSVPGHSNDTAMFVNALIDKRILNESLPGYEGKRTIELMLYVPDGIQNVSLFLNS